MTVGAILADPVRVADQIPSDFLPAGAEAVAAHLDSPRSKITILGFGSRVERITQTIAQEVVGQHRHQDKQPRNE